jgi:hypothetical protein
MYHTMQDFLTFTKGSCYILAGLAVVIFIPFWLFLTDREKKN